MNVKKTKSSKKIVLKITMSMTDASGPHNLQGGEIMAGVDTRNQRKSEPL